MHCVVILKFPLSIKSQCPFRHTFKLPFLAPPTHLSTLQPRSQFCDRILHRLVVTCTQPSFNQQCCKSSVPVSHVVTYQQRTIFFTQIHAYTYTHTHSHTEYRHRRLHVPLITLSIYTRNVQKCNANAANRQVNQISVVFVIVF